MRVVPPAVNTTYYDAARHQPLILPAGQQARAAVGLGWGGVDGGRVEAGQGRRRARIRGTAGSGGQVDALMRPNGVGYRPTATPR